MVCRRGFSFGAEGDGLVSSVVAAAELVESCLSRFSESDGYIDDRRFRSLTASAVYESSVLSGSSFLRFLPLRSFPSSSPIVSSEGAARLRDFATGAFSSAVTGSLDAEAFLDPIGFARLVWEPLTARFEADAGEEKRKYSQLLTWMKIVTIKSRTHNLPRDRVSSD